MKDGNGLLFKKTNLFILFLNQKSQKARKNKSNKVHLH